jgi:SNF2 family DNA or RNA helicase
MELYEHQRRTVEFLHRAPRTLDLSDCGTGKTRAVLAEFVERRQQGGSKALVFAPKGILEPTWVQEIRRWFPGITWSVAHADRRWKAFQRDADIYLINTDAASWCARNLPAEHWRDFGTLIVDESSSFKNPDSQRSNAMRALVQHFPFRRLLSGTPCPNSITDIWHQVHLLDDGQRLGPSFWRFRDAVCEPIRGAAGWQDKPEAQQMVFRCINDVTIRHRFEDCLSIPPNHSYSVMFDLPEKLMHHYQCALHSAVLRLKQERVVTRFHAVALATKLFQIASGALYTDKARHYAVLDRTRVELVMDLLRERPHSIVAFQWRHQRDELVRAAKGYGYSFGVLDGSVSEKDRSVVVRAFQDGGLKALFVHPRTAAHGLNLTRGTTTIWASPTYSSEAYHQLRHRIHRAGQTQKTETIHVLARNTIDERVYARLGTKLDAMALLLEFMAEREDCRS